MVTPTRFRALLALGVLCSARTASAGLESGTEFLPRKVTGPPTPDPQIGDEEAIVSARKVLARILGPGVGGLRADSWSATVKREDLPMASSQWVRIPSKKF